MTIVCSACQRYLGTQPPFHDKGVTHGLCTPCAVRQRQELRTLVLSRDRADTWPVLSCLFRGADCNVVVDRRKIDRRREDVAVDVCRRASARDRRRVQSLRLV
jgi:hypothetical protein